MKRLSSALALLLCACTAQQRLAAECRDRYPMPASYQIAHGFGVFGALVAVNNSDVERVKQQRLDCVTAGQRQ